MPCKVWFESERTALNLLNLRSEVARFTELVGAERHRAPKLVDWMLANPFRVLDAEDDWNRMVRTVLWIDEFGGPDRYLRQVDVPGVDTKFIETHRGILGRLLDHQLSSDRVDQTSPRSDIAGRYGLKKKPHYVRFRFLSPQPSGFSEISVHVEELAERPPPVSRVFAVENEITYLAFPEVTDSLLILAGGYAIPTFAPLQWLSSCELRYWGDIDTHGFAILNQLRRAFPATRALLMDRATLLAHEAHWGTESEQTRAALQSLNNDESALYQDLIENSFADGVRLEQERVRFSAIEAALQAIRDSTPE